MPATLATNQQPQQQKQQKEQIRRGSFSSGGVKPALLTIMVFLLFQHTHGFTTRSSSLTTSFRRRVCTASASSYTNERRWGGSRSSSASAFVGSAQQSSHNNKILNNSASLRVVLSMCKMTTSTTQTSDEDVSTINDNTKLPTTSSATASASATVGMIQDYDIKNAAMGLAGTSYEPSTFETNIYQWWEHSGCFDPDAKPQSSSTSSDQKKKKEPYVLPMPPPNVTGRLHMGHAIFVALQDVLARFHRMRGRPVLWTPGTDHAGIATQLQVEKLIVADGKRRGSEEEIFAIQHDTTLTSSEKEERLSKLVDRADFLTKAWSYKSEQGGAITSQLRALGASADWSRERFTMDPDMSTGVIEAFVRLYDKGLIYRGTYMVNWSPGLMTAVSDLEVEYSEEEGKLYYFKYIVEGSEEYIPVATTRPETIFGDSAVCVNPNDIRYQHLIGKRVLVPMSSSGGSSSSSSTGTAGASRSIPVIADEYVDMEFGSGALKITPGHDVNDYELGKKYNLDIINVMNRDATMNTACGPTYVGLDRFVAREKLWQDMEVAGLTIKVTPHTQRVPRSQRGGEIIEPMVSKQWFVKMSIWDRRH
jgi:valyl-tRNA synthetase